MKWSGILVSFHGLATILPNGLFPGGHQTGQIHVSPLSSAARGVRNYQGSYEPKAPPGIFAEGALPRVLVENRGR